jgi:hypothetical protein
MSNQQFKSQYEQNYASNQQTSPLYEVSGNMSDFGFLKNFEKVKKWTNDFISHFLPTCHTFEA